LQVEQITEAARKPYTSQQMPPRPATASHLGSGCVAWIIVAAS
jgi:hypothetical protein